jgi:hypothetical protein
MTKFENPSFSVYPGGEKNYRDNYDRIFGKKKDKPDPWAIAREAEPKKMSDLPPARDAQPAPPESVKNPKKAKKNEKTKAAKKK